MAKNNVIQKIINDQIHYYDTSYGILLDSIISKLKAWTVIFGILHLLLINIFAKYALEINDDGIMFVLPPFINIIFTLLPFSIFEIIMVLIKKHNDINYIMQYYPRIAEKLWLPYGSNGFAWLKFINYEYIKQKEDVFIDNIIENSDDKMSVYRFVFFGNLIVLILGFICLMYWV